MVAFGIFTNFLLRPLRGAGRIVALATLSVITLAAYAEAQKATVQVSWSLPSSTAGISEYRVYVRSASGSYPATTPYKVASATATTLASPITDLDPGSYFFVAKSYDSSSQQESLPSNEVAITASVAMLEGRTAAQSNGKVFSVKAYTSGQTTSPLVDVNCTANNNGVITIPTGATGLPSAFDLRVKSAGYLALRIPRTLSGTTALTALPAGDLNTDPNAATQNVINSADYSLFKPKWFTADAIADFNGDGVVNNTDYGYLKANWFKSDQM